MVVHDFSGHPFQVQLARELAARGQPVVHLYCASFQANQGHVGVDSTDSSFRSEGLVLRRPFSKYSFTRRLLQEAEYGVRLSKAVSTLRPSAVISANTPLMAAAIFHLSMKLVRVPVVFWQQDVYSTAMANHLERRAGRVGRLLGRVFVRTEMALARGSACVVAIREDFLPTLRSWGVPTERTFVIENWAPLDELPLRARPNSWSERHGVDPSSCILLYAGTLGLKHQPSLLLDLARSFADRGDVRVLVASEGLGATWLADNTSPSDRLELFGFQPYEDLPDMLATADIVLVLLEPEAGAFSVPSKVLTYHCAGRPILGAMPAENLASRIIESNRSGIVVEPDDAAAFVAAAHLLVDDPDLRATMGRSGRRYAETTFDIERIGDRFVEVLGSVGIVVTGPGGVGSR